MHSHETENGTRAMPDFEKRGGLLPVVVQEYPEGRVLMLGYVNQEALEETFRSGMATFYSTSRNELWTKGKTSGDYLKIKEIRIDCDQDALLYIVELAGTGVCHTKNSKGITRKACFYRKYTPDFTGLSFLEGEN